MSDLAALWYADRRALLQTIRAIRRKPGRAILWTFYLAGSLLWLLLSFRVNAGLHRHLHFGTVASADYLICGYLLFFGVVLAFGSGAPLFRNAAEARFLVAAPLDPRLIIAYLQVRQLVSNLWRYVYLGAYVPMTLSAVVQSPAQILLDVLLVFCAFTAITSIVLPRRLAPPLARAICMVAGTAIILFGAITILRDVAIQTRSAAEPWLWGHTPHIFPGEVLIHPHLGWAVLVIAVAAAATTALALTSRDAYPELYAISTRAVQRRARRLADLEWSRRPSRGFKSGKAPAGVLALTWTALIAHRRSGSAALKVALLLASFAGGSALAVAGRAPALVASFSPLVMLLLLRNLLTFVGIGRELRRPIFWLSRASLYERLWAVALGYVWFPSVLSFALAAGFAVAGGSVQSACYLAAGGAVGFTLLATINIALFALFPNAVDQRGPMLAVRFLMLMILLVPALVTSAVVGFATHSLPLAFAGAVVVALSEGALLIGSATWRLEGHTDLLVSA